MGCGRSKSRINSSGRPDSGRRQDDKQTAPSGRVSGAGESDGTGSKVDGPPGGKSTTVATRNDHPPGQVVSSDANDSDGQDGDARRRKAPPGPGRSMTSGYAERQRRLQQQQQQQSPQQPGGGVGVGVAEVGDGRPTGVSTGEAGDCLPVGPGCVTNVGPAAPKVINVSTRVPVTTDRPNLRKSQSRLTASQIEFFRMVDEKIALGKDYESDDADDDNNR